MPMLRILACLFMLAALPALADGAQYEVRVDKVERAGGGYKASVAYPQLSGLAASVAESFNTRAKDQAEQQARAFVTEVQEVRKDMPPEQAAIELSLTTQVETKHVSSHLVALLVTGYEFLGGAHGQPLYETVALDAVDGRDLEIQDMFKPNAAWVQVVSKSAIAQLGRRAKELDTTADWIRTGAGPDVKNFQVFWPGEDGLHFLFPNYSVAPYSAGAPEVVVPYRSLEGMLNDRYFH